jgi:hypothetical protein
MLFEGVGDLIDVPISQQRAIIMDCMLDLVLASKAWKSVASMQDIVLLVKQTIDANYEIKPESEKLSFAKDLASKLDLCLLSSDISGTERLVRAMEKSNADETATRIHNIVVHENTVVVRVPNYDDKNTGVVDNLGKFLWWATTIMGIKNPTVKILKDSNFGSAVTMPTRVSRMMDNTIASFTLPAGEMGERSEFKSGFKANLVELIAAVRLMRKYAGVLQKVAAPKGHKSVQTTLDDLRKSLNTRCGLEDHGIDAFTKTFVKSVLNEITKPNWKSFPGKWIHSLKETNGTKNNIGVMYRLGYESRVPNPSKVIHVLNTGVRTKKEAKPSGKTKAGKDKFEAKSFETFVYDDKTLPDGITHQEFRFATFLLLPLIDPKDKRSPKDQLHRDPLSVKDRKITTFYNKNRDVVDAMNLAYATKSALGKKGSKATPLGYQSARGHAIRLTANREWIDAAGTSYGKLTDIPEHTRNFLLSFFRRILTEEEPEEDDDTSEDEKELADKTVKSERKG